MNRPSKQTTDAPARIIKHAARDPWTRVPLHDLHEWDVRQEWGDERPGFVPRDAKPHRGYLAEDGAQIVVWQAKRPPSPEVDEAAQPSIH